MHIYSQFQPSPPLVHSFRSQPSAIQQRQVISPLPVAVPFGLKRLSLLGVALSFLMTACQPNEQPDILSSSPLSEKGAKVNTNPALELALNNTDLCRPAHKGLVKTILNAPDSTQMQAYKRVLLIKKIGPEEKIPFWFSLENVVRAVYPDKITAFEQVRRTEISGKP